MAEVLHECLFEFGEGVVVLFVFVERPDVFLVEFEDG